MTIRINNSDAWQSRTVRAGGPARRGAAGAGPDLPKEFLAEGVQVDQVEIIEPRRTRAAAPAPLLDLTVDLAPDERAVIAVRHPSGALTFHKDMEVAPVARGGRRGARRPARAAHFRIPIRPQTLTAADGRVRRGLVSRVFKAIVLKVKEAVIDKAVSVATEMAAKGFEKLWWAAHDFEEGWRHVTPDALRARDLPAADFGVLDTGARALLLLHGTFSNAASAFGPLADAAGDFFGSLQPIYGERIFAFNHFTLSRSPEENAQMLLEGLPPNRRTTFDVITHSRGGLVLRQLVERRGAFGRLGDRFELGHAVLVAAPNAGTPLATPKRWEDTFGFIATILEMFPDNPWTTGPAFVANGIVWLAGHVVGDLPGLAAMDGNGPVITDLQAPPGPSADAYSALAANYHPDEGIMAKLVDVGVDSFFNGANDLVVPTEGGWLVDAASGPAIPGERIGCFGRQGNLDPASGDSVHHLNFFKQSETVQFLIHALKGEAQGLPPVDPLAPLPMRVLLRGGAGGGRAKPPAPAGMPAAAPRPPIQLAARVPRKPPEPARRKLAGTRGCPFQIIILWRTQDPTELDQTASSLDGSPGHEYAQIMALYDNACVIEPFPTKDPRVERRAGDKEPGAETQQFKARMATLTPGARFSRIIRMHEQVRNFYEGKPDKDGKWPEPLTDAQLRIFGQLLFDALFSGNVRRLYDVARSEPRDGPLDVIFTCTIPWIADKPWEFAFDPSRQKFLVTEEVHFARNVVTAVPAQDRELDSPPLRILVVAAQPLGHDELSAHEEEELIRNGFSTLMAAGLAEIDVLTDATPKKLHVRLLEKALEAERDGRPQSEAYDIVHFIGHGDFDAKAGAGTLIFRAADGGPQEMTTQELKELLCSRGVQLVFLNACESGRDSRQTRNRGVAQALMAGGVPSVIANQYKVLDPSATAFAEHFYWALAAGTSLGAAAREARIALNYSVDGEIIDWAVPVLYARDPNFRLRGPSLEVAPLPERIQPRAGAARRAPPLADSDVRRVAVADLARAFPQLDSTLQQLNTLKAVKGHFFFQRADIVVPLDSWRLWEDSDDSYLHADYFAERIRRKPVELGVDLLACITDKPMLEFDAAKDRKPKHVYTWWPNDPDQLKIMLFSTAELAIPPSGPKTDAIIANFLGSTLAGFLANCDVHSGGQKDCALYEDPEPNLETISGRQVFCPACRKLLKKAKLPKADIDALEAILNAFQGPK